MKGYGKHYNLSLSDKKAILAFIAIRHFDIQATIIESLGLNCVDNGFLDKQIIWLEKWKKLAIENNKVY